MEAAPRLSLRERLALPYFYMRFGPTGSGPHTNLVYGARLSGPLDPTALEAAYVSVLAEAPALRGWFSGPDAPPERLTGTKTPPFSVIDATGDVAAFKAAVRAAAAQPFVLAEFPLMAMTLVRHSRHQHVLVLAAHHLLMDGWSIVMFLRALSERYRGRVRQGGEQPVWHPGEEAETRAAFLASQDAQQIRDAAAAWLGPAAKVLTPRITVGFPNAAEVHGMIRLPQAPLRAASCELRTSAVALHRLLFVLLQQTLTANAALAFSEAHANRPAHGLETFGFISDDLLLRVDTSPDDTWRMLSAKVAKAHQTARGFATIPASQILRTLDPAAPPLPRFHFNPLSVGSNVLRLGPVKARPIKLMPALGVAEMVFVSGEIDRVLIALAGGRVDGVGFEAMRRALLVLAHGLAEPDRPLAGLVATARAAMA